MTLIILKSLLLTRPLITSTITFIMGPHFSGSDEPNKVRMMVFETDDPHPDTSEERGSFGQIFDELFKKAGDGHDPPLGIETSMQFVVEEKGGSVPTVEELEDVHAILITGSMYDAHGDDEWITKLVKLLKGKSCIYSTNSI